MEIEITWESFWEKCFIVDEYLERQSGCARTPLTSKGMVFCYQIHIRKSEQV